MANNQRANNQSALLRIEGLSLSRQLPSGQMPVLTDIDLEVYPGQWIVLLGSNGSGKTSLLKYLAGENSPLDDVTGNTPITTAIMFQDPDEQIIAQTVGQELSLGRPELNVPQVLNQFGLGARVDLDPRMLSAGQKQRLVLAVAEAGNPKLLLCDEPTALQDPQQQKWVLDRLDIWRKQDGRALITATQDYAEAARADLLLVLEQGKIVLSGSPAEILHHQQVSELLGSGRGALSGIQIYSPDQKPENSTKHPVLDLSDVSCGFLGTSDGLGPVNIQVFANERIGLVGPNGCGKSTLLAVSCGARKPDYGSVTLCGQKLYQRGNMDLDHGAALLAPQFPEYLFTRSTVADEISLDPALANRTVKDVLSAAGLPAALADRHPHSLSSGQRRRLAVALVVFSKRQLLLLDEPTAALDWSGRNCVLELMSQIPSETAVLVASHDEIFLESIGCKIIGL